MKFLNEAIEAQIQTDLLVHLIAGEYAKAIENLMGVLDSIYDAIPEKKRISYGRYTTVKELAKYLYDEAVTNGLPVVEIGAAILGSAKDVRAKGVGLGMLSFYGVEDHKAVLPYFERAAQSEDWELREYAQGMCRKIVKAHPAEMRFHLLRFVKSENANLRRFVSEMLRPAVENKWLYDDLDYSLSILRHLFTESDAYPRTSVGNNLSDIARREPELAFQLVDELMALEDKNAAWIATRACRNLVKEHPIRVMDALGVDEYRYKKNVYRREDFS